MIQKLKPSTKKKTDLFSAQKVDRAEGLIVNFSQDLALPSKVYLDDKKGNIAKIFINYR